MFFETDISNLRNENQNMETDEGDRSNEENEVDEGNKNVYKII